MRGSGAASSTTTDGSSRPSRPGVSRRGAPSGRALVGGLLVALAAVIVVAAYAGAQEAPSHSVAVAARDLAPGQTLSADDLEVRAVEVPDDVAARSFSSTDRLVGAVTLGPVQAGELLQRGSVRTDADGSNGPEFSFPVERERALAGAVRPGEEVDLLATFGSGSDASTVVLARGARVLQVDDARSATLGSSGRLVLTVGLATDAEVVDVAHASQVAVITLVRPSATAGGPS